MLTAAELICEPGLVSDAGFSPVAGYPYSSASDLGASVAFVTAGSSKALPHSERLLAVTVLITAVEPDSRKLGTSLYSVPV